MKPVNRVNQQSRAARLAAKKAQGKRIKMPGPTARLFGHAIVDNKLVVVGDHPSGTIEHHAIENDVLKAHFDAAKVSRKWPDGAEVPEEVFLSAIEAVAGAKVGAFPGGIVAKDTKEAAAARAAAVAAKKPSAPAATKTAVPLPPDAKASAAKSEVK